MQPRLLRSPARLAGSSLLRLQSDERLVELARDGHEQAFAAIVERYRGNLERYASRLVGPSRGEDAVQQAFVNAHRALTSNPDKTIELRPWLYRIVHNAALNTLRATRDEQPLGEDAERLGLTDDAIERRELLREALDAIASLPAGQRDAILLRELEGRSHEEIALALGVSAGAARQQIFRARAALRAAATAITPQPLIIKLMEMATAGASSGGPDIATAAGGGIAAVLVKASAGVLVTGAVAGGAVGTGVVDLPDSHHHRSSGNEAAAKVAHARQAARKAAAAKAATAPVSERLAGARHTGQSSDDTKRDHGHRGPSGDSGRRKAAAKTAPVVTPKRHSSSNSGPGSHSGTGEQHHSGGDETSGSHHQSGKGKSGSGKHGAAGGSSTGGTAEATEVEAPEVENEAPGDVSGKNKGSDGGGGAPTATTPDPAAAPAGPAPDPAAAGGGGGKNGGVTAEALAPSSGGKK